ncbi:MAG: homocysteine S-methyltransferase family protein [Candidatus Zixiibacteriota bacterium]
MSELIDRLKKGEVLLADGGIGTMLFQRGLKSGECPEKINLDHPEIPEEISHLYFEAGADIVTTNTFGGSPLKLAQYGLAEKTAEINIAAVKASRRAVGNEALVAASIGPCGALLKPYGDIDPQKVAECFSEQAAALLSAGPDAVFIETMTDLTEATLAIKAVRSHSSTVPIAATMTFDPTPGGFHTIMGISIQQAANGLVEAGADIIGSNCGNGIDNMVKIGEQFTKHSRIPVIIQSNAGLPNVNGDKLVYNETPQYMAQKCLLLLEFGVNIIGGCCGTTPQHTAALRKIIDAHNGRQRTT